MIGSNPENTEFYLTLHRPGGEEVARLVHPQELDGAQSFNLAHLAAIARGMRSETGEHDGTVTFDIRKAAVQPNFSDGSRLQTFADGRIEVDIDEQLIRIDNRPKVLSVKQFALVALLSSRVDYIWPHGVLARQIVGDEHTPRSNMRQLFYSLQRNLGPELRHGVATSRIPSGYFARSSLKTG